MLSSKEKIFLNMLSDFLEGNKTVLPENSDINSLSDLARAQECDAILFYQTRLSSSNSSFAAVSYYALNRKFLLKQLHTAFCEKNIPYIIFKGTEIAKYYPKPELRAMGDIDILVKQEDKEKAAEIITELGFIRENTHSQNSNNHEWIFFSNQFEIELHHRLLYNDDFNLDIHTAFTDMAWENSTTDDGIYHTLKTEFHFVFLLLHIRKHILWSGIGIRQFLDIAVMIKNSDIDWVNTEILLNNLELLPFAKTCFALVDKFFGISSPLTPTHISDEFYNTAIKSILEGNVVSFSNDSGDEKLDNQYINRFNKENPNSLKKLFFALKLFFPSYIILCDKYPHLKKLGIIGYIIIPLMWIHRAVGSIFKKTAIKGIGYSVKPFSISGKIKERNDLLKQWGIM